MSNTSSPPIDIGLSEDQRQAIAEGLSAYLADAYTLYLRTHAAHWNITGPMFNSLHAMFEEQYTEQWSALDEIAERIRALGFLAPGSHAEFAQLTSLEDDSMPINSSDWRALVARLVSGNQAVCRSARKVMEIADSSRDDATVDLLTQRLSVHEKVSWMLRSLLDDPTQPKISQSD